MTAGPGSSEPVSSTLARDPRLAEALHGILYRVELSPSELNATVEGLEGRHGTAVYSELIFALCHLYFEGGEAKRCWEEIVNHRETMQERLGSPVDLRVALASYFLQVNRKLKNPKLIELKLFEETRASAYRDELTDLYNYRFFSEFLRYEISRAERTNTPLSLAMLDVDDFKHYNDENGHEIGNVALRGIAGLLTATLHRADIAARYGGEEFALILPATPKKGAQLVAERIRAKIDEYSFPNQQTQPGGRLTVSVGVATFPGDARETGELVACADRAMYAAKAEGKNQVRLFGQSFRSYHRVGADVEGSVQILGSELMPLTCVELSMGGLRFLTDRRPPPGALIEVTLKLPGPHGTISVTGRVVQATSTDSGRFAIGSRILSMDATDQQRLTGYMNQLIAHST